MGYSKKGSEIMEKGLLVYKSKYGATKKYVSLLREELCCHVCEAKSCKDFHLESYAWIIFAGGIYAGHIAGLDVLRKQYPRIKEKRLAVFCVGASPFDEKSFAQIKAQTLKQELRKIPAFYGRGAWDESRMTWLDRTLCGMLKKAVSKKDPASCEPWMKELLSFTGQSCDWTDREYLLPLIAYIKGFSSEQSRK